MGIYRRGTWVLDFNGNNVYDASDLVATYGGLTNDIPVVGKWNGSAKSLIGVFRGGAWIMDVNANYGWDGGDFVTIYGKSSNDTPVVGNW